MKWFWYWQKKLSCENELLDCARNDKNDVVETIYFGGGTPSILEISDLKFLIDAVYKHFDVIENPEITIEANPDDLSPSLSFRRNLFEELKAIGVNRLFYRNSIIF